MDVHLPSSATRSGRDRSRPRVARAQPAYRLVCGLSVLLAAFTAVVAAPGAGGADTAPFADLERAERAAVQDLYAAEIALGDADERLAAAVRQASIAAGNERRAQRDAARVATSVATLRTRADATLRALYISGEAPDGIAVILGAATLDDAVAGLDGLATIGRAQRSLARQLAARQLELERTAGRARDARRVANAAAADAASARAVLAQALAARSGTLAAVRARLADQRAALARAERSAANASTRARAINQEATTAAAATSATASQGTEGAAPTTSTTPASAPAGGTRTLVVEALAYHLPGTTASGLPVGVGIIAVDPTVIPLGTRVFVPGYGPAVAADTGSAIKGHIIDLWMPSIELARAWGRRTVTITIYG